MKLLRANFYQAIELPTLGRSTNYNSVSDDIVKGVMLSVENQFVIVEHPTWDTAIVVPTANVRSMVTKALPIPEDHTQPLDMVSGEQAEQFLASVPNIMPQDDIDHGVKQGKIPAKKRRAKD